jgi:putative flippase GtrA
VREAFVIFSSSVARPVGRGLRLRRNWLQLTKFCAVGGSGYAVNLAVYSWLLQHTGMPFRLVAVCSFLVAVTNNYALNRAWTFAEQRGHVGVQGARYLIVSLVGLGGNLVFLTLLVALGAGELPAQAVAVALMTPVTFAANKLWSFGR